MTGYPNPLLPAPPRRRGRGRLAVAALVVIPVAVLAMLGVWANVRGHRKPPPAVAAPQALKLPDIMVSPEEVADIVGAVQMEIAAEGDRLIPTTEYGVTVDKRDCNAVWYPGLQSTYGQTTLSATYSRLASSKTEQPPYSVLQTIVEYRGNKDNRAVYTNLAAHWEACAGQVVEVVGAKAAFAFGALTNSNNMVAIKAVGVNNPGLGCGRVMRLRDNIIIDVQVCRPDIADQAVVVANRITDNIPH